MTGWPAPQLALPAGRPVWPTLAELHDLARRARHPMIVEPPRATFIQYPTPEVLAAFPPPMIAVRYTVRPGDSAARLLWGDDDA